MSKRKTLEEQILSLKKNQGSWIGPFREWINEAQTVEQISKSADLELKKVLAKKIFGSDLFLENKKFVGMGKWLGRHFVPTRQVAVVWAHMGSNHGPHSYQECALPLSHAPCICQNFICRSFATPSKNALYH